MAVDLHQDWIHDVRQPVVGDSFTWYATEPVAAKKSFVIHATASDAPQEDAFVIADYHVNHNGWGGVGVHFLVTKDSYSGKSQFGIPGGAGIQYCGDLGTLRAGTVNQNNGRVHLEISGNFTTPGSHPSEGQLRKVRQLIDYLRSPNNILPSFSYGSQVTYHNAVPGQNTACPGWANPLFKEWFTYLQGGAEPKWFSTQQKSATPSPAPAPAPIVNAVAPPTHSNPVPPEYAQTWTAFPEVQKMTITVPNFYAKDVSAAENPIGPLPVGQVIDAAGHFKDNGVLYYRTAYSAQHNKWYGVDANAFNVGQVADQVLPITITSGTTSVSAEVTQAQLSLLSHISAFFANLFAPLLALFNKNKG